MDMLSMAIGFLAGVAATYLVRFFLSDDSQKQTSVPTVIKNDALSEQLWRTHEKLLREMQQDLSKPEFQLHREFVIDKKGWNWNRFGFHRHGPCLVYFIEDHIDLPGQLDTLVSNGLISKIDEKKGKFHFSEKFTEWLRRK
ncbi:MAG: hypothetical protein WAT53_02915 [Nitrosomonas sp.]|jgi:hypothetical protein|nr:hypothetical protein [Nitrosomonas sp.]MCC7135704.1 hypothetical protein [Nitrosomonas sp.]